MDAKEMIRKLEKLFNEHKLKRITQENEEFTASKGDKEYHRKRVINHYFDNGKLTWVTTHIIARGYEYIQIDEPKEDSEYVHGQDIYENFD